MPEITRRSSSDVADTLCHWIEPGGSSRGWHVLAAAEALN